MTDQLIKFLDKVIEDIRQGTLTQTQLTSLGGFRLGYESQLKQEAFTKEQTMKYITLGWYIYENLLNQ